MCSNGFRVYSIKSQTIVFLALYYCCCVVDFFFVSRTVLSIYLAFENSMILVTVVDNGDTVPSCYDHVRIRSLQFDNSIYVGLYTLNFCKVERTTIPT